MKKIMYTVKIYAPGRDVEMVDCGNFETMLELVAQMRRFGYGVTIGRLVI